MRARLGASLLLLLLGGCAPSTSSAPGIELALGDDAAAPSEYHRVPIRLSRSRSRFAPAGLLLEASVRRPSGARGKLVLDLPDPGAAQGASPVVSYGEQDAGGRVLFQSTRAAGRIELSADPGCPCQTGRLELLFVDPGPDGALGGGDDRRRRLGSARIRVDDRPFCHARASIPIREDLLVVGSRACPVAGRRGGGSVGAWLAVGGLAGIGWNDGDWYEEGWCGDYEPGDDGAYGGYDGPGSEWEEGWTDGYGWGDDASSGGNGWGGSYGDDGSWDGGSYDDGSWDDGASEHDWWDDGVSGWGSDGSSSDDGSWEEDAWTSDDGDSWSDDGSSDDSWGDDSWDDE
jgi:hypothetical protein